MYVCILSALDLESSKELKDVKAGLVWEAKTRGNRHRERTSRIKTTKSIGKQHFVPGENNSINRPLLLRTKRPFQINFFWTSQRKFLK